MIVHLVRHAKSSWDEPGLDDADRPLAARGRRSAQKLARHLGKAGVAPTLVLCSPARRARQTLEIIAEALPADTELVVEAGLYGADADDLLARLRRIPREHVQALLVGHNPALQDLALALAGAGAPSELRGKLPTGSLVSLRPRGASWRTLRTGEAEVTELWRPRSDSNRRSPP